MESLSLAGRASPKEEHENVYIIIQRSVAPTATVNTCEGPLPAGSTPGEETCHIVPPEAMLDLAVFTLYMATSLFIGQMILIFFFFFPASTMLFPLSPGINS